MKARLVPCVNRAPDSIASPARTRLLQRKRTPTSFDSHASEVPAIVQEVLGSPGQPLDPQTRAFMEPRFGHDFGHVRVHADGKAAESARAVNSLAYTVGHNVVFGENKYVPTTQTGRELLAHELAHTTQQGNGSGAPRFAEQDGILESSAIAAGHDISGGGFVSRDLSTSGLALARQPTSTGKLEDQQLADELQRLTEKLRREASYTGREKDLKRYFAIKPIVQKGGRERAAAVDEALAVVAQMEQQLDEGKEEKPTPVSLTLPTGTARRGASPSPGPRKSPPRRGTPSKFEPGGFTDEDIKAVAEAEKLERKRKISEDAERINNDPLWLIPGAIGRTEHGRQMWKQIQKYYGSPDVPGAGFFKSQIFRDWFFGGQAKILERFEEKPIETYNQIQWLTLWLTEKGQERAQLITMIASAIIPQRVPGGFGSSPRPFGGGGGARLRPRPSATTRVTPKPGLSSGVPQEISNEPTARIPAGEPSPVESIGNYKIVGTKTLRGDVFERKIGSIALPEQYEKNPRAFLQVVNTMEQEAKAAGAKTLKITGWAVKNPGFGEKIRPWVIKKGGSFNLSSGSTEAGNAVIEITLPIK